MDQLSLVWVVLVSATLHCCRFHLVLLSITYHCCRSHLVRGCVVLWVVAVVVAGAVASSQHQLAVAWLVLSVQVTSPSDTVG